jgi:hypothetical protein
MRPESKLEPRNGSRFRPSNGMTSLGRVGDVDLISFLCGRDAVYQDVLIDAGDIYRLWPATRPSADKAASIMAQESRCRAALVLRMRAAAENPIPKRTLKQDFPQLGTRAFNRAFVEAAEEAKTPAWLAPGRRKKAAPLIDTRD